jgi:hypothetical protein
MNITEEQALAFSFTGENKLWENTLAIIDSYIEKEVFFAIDKHTVGEGRIHAAGRADGVNGLKETLLWFREEALKKRGLTDKDFVA